MCCSISKARGIMFQRNPGHFNKIPFADAQLARACIGSLAYDVDVQQQQRAILTVLRALSFHTPCKHSEVH